MLPLPLASKVAVPTVKPLVVSLKVTVPVAVGPDDDFTLAENVKDWPKVEGLGFAEAVTVAPAPTTIWVSTVDVLGECVASPPWAAVMECDPAARVLIARVALPVASKTPE